MKLKLSNDLAMINSKTGNLSEFDIIAQYFSNIGNSSVGESGVDESIAGESEAKSDVVGIEKISAEKSSVILGGGDDCALICVANDQQLALSIDTLLEGVHFPANAHPADIAGRALRVAISDLAAMGARPLAFTLAIALPGFDSDWLQQFSDGLNKCANKYQIPLIGGDTTRGPLAITIQVHGTVNKGAALRRSGAQIGDGLYLTGHTGDAAIALDIIQQRLTVTDQMEFFHGRFYHPQARIQFGQNLCGIANSAIDISDGLLADTGHIAKASAVGIRLFANQIPLSPAVLELIETGVISEDKAIEYALTGGDDYELCFSVSPQQQAALEECINKVDLPVSKIGDVIAGDGVHCIAYNGEILEFSRNGFQHF